MLAILVLAIMLVWGFALVRLTGIRLRVAERAVVGPVAGLATGSMVFYLLSAGAGGLSAAVLAGGAGVLGLASLVSVRRPRLPREPVPGWFVGVVVAVGGALVAMNLYGVLAPVDGGSVIAAEHIWADTPFHSSIVTSFAYRDNFPPTYPLALGEPLGYPFMVDFLTGVLVYGGLGLRAAFVLVNVLVQVAFFAGLAAIVHRLTDSAATAVLATFVCFALGNLGWLAIPADVAEAGGWRAWLSDIPWSYTGDALGDKGRDRLGIGVYLGNPTFIYFLPRRAAAFGLAVAVAILILLERLVERRRLWPAVLAGVLFGLLPRIHAHSVMAVAAFALVWAVASPARKGVRGMGNWAREWRDAAPTWLLVVGVAVVVALPQIAAMSRQASGFVDWWVGWTGEPHAAFAEAGVRPGGERLGAVASALATTAWFWVVNGGLLLLLAIPAWWRASVRVRIWYLPVIVLWLFANVVRTQPWEWDNNNFFVYWQFGTVVLVAPMLASLLAASDGRPSTALARRVGGVVLIAGLTLGGFLSFGYAAQHRQHLWTAEEVRFADTVRGRTPPDASILTANAHSHPVIALSGRQTFMGFAGWFVSHGLDWDRYETRLERMYAGDVGLMRELGIDHVVIGPWERGLAADKRFELADVFEDPDVFRPLVRATLPNGEWSLLELRPADR